jgi:hypothetical protein
VTSAALDETVGTLCPDVGRLRMVRPDEGRAQDVTGESPSGEWITGAEAARLAGVEATTVWRAGGKGLILRRTLGGGGHRPASVEYERTSVLEWAASRRPSPDSPGLASIVERHDAELEAIRERVRRLEQRGT